GQLLIETLTRCAPRDHPYNLHVRSIVQPARVTGCHNPHYVEYGSGHVQVNADKLPFDGPFAPYVACEAIRANHYWTRDEWYFYNCKLPRSRRAGFYRPNALVEERLAVFNSCQSDGAILRFVPALRMQLGSDKPCSRHGWSDCLLADS